MRLGGAPSLTLTWVLEYPLVTFLTLRITFDMMGGVGASAEDCQTMGSVFGCDAMRCGAVCVVQHGVVTTSPMLSRASSVDVAKSRGYSALKVVWPVGAGGTMGAAAARLAASGSMVVSKLDTRCTVAGEYAMCGLLGAGRMKVADDCGRDSWGSKNEVLRWLAAALVVLGGEAGTPLPPCTAASWCGGK